MTELTPTPDAAVRTARGTDAEQVGAVQALLWRAAYGRFLSPELLAEFTPEAFGAVWAQSLTAPPSPRHRLLVATQGQDLVGFVAVGPATTDSATTDPVNDVEGAGPTGEILVGGVLDTHRRTGHGSRLLNAAVDTLRAGDFGRVEMWVLALDTQTLDFAEQAGLEADGAWRERALPGDAVAPELRLRAWIGPQDS
ncbi:MAG: GNAT family N-acetyltransferase [Allobranchiibius sp.]